MPSWLTYAAGALLLAAGGAMHAVGVPGGEALVALGLGLLGGRASVRPPPR